MNKTQIEWVKNPDGTQGYTWNPITGCLNGCSYCYARELANGRLKTRYLDNLNIAPTSLSIEALHEAAVDPFYPRFWVERLDKLNPVYGQDRRQPTRGVFVCDMSDLFGIGVPDHWTYKILDRISEYPLHRFYLLTKQPQNLQKFSPFPDNCWVGVSATNQMGYESALLTFLNLKAKVKYISFEPLLGRVDPKEFCFYEWDKKPGVDVDWVIIGAQTKPYNPPKIEWVKEIVEAADKAGVPVFLKNNLSPLIAKLNVNDKWVWAKDLGYGGLYRQEIPSL